VSEGNGEMVQVRLSEEPDRRVSRLADARPSAQKMFAQKKKRPGPCPRRLANLDSLTGNGDNYGFVGVGVVVVGFGAVVPGVAAGFAAAGFPGVATPPLTGYA
jgi:hypothetical protein